MSRIDGVLAAVGSVAGLKVVDVGCGEGQVAKALAERGATVVGYDPFIAPTEWIACGQGRYRLDKASADAIPEPDGSADLVLFVFSLHHVPGIQLDGALAEARRLLRPSGRLCVSEPLAEGPTQYVMELYHDETAVRAAAAGALVRAAPLFAREQVFRHTESRSFPDFDAFAVHALAGMRFNGYSRQQVLAPGVRRRFDEMYRVHQGRLDLPIRINLFA